MSLALDGKASKARVQGLSSVPYSFNQNAASALHHTQWNHPDDTLVNTSQWHITNDISNPLEWIYNIPNIHIAYAFQHLSIW